MDADVGVGADAGVAVAVEAKMEVEKGVVEDVVEEEDVVEKEKEKVRRRNYKANIDKQSLLLPFPNPLLFRSNGTRSAREADLQKTE